MYFMFSIFIGAFMMNLHHLAIHKNKHWITSIITCGWYLKPFHAMHHKNFLEGEDDFSWARKEESFYKFFMRTHFKRRQMAGKESFILDILSFSVMSYFFSWYYIAIVISFTFHWEVFEYWSHYALKGITKDKFKWSWNVLGKKFNHLMLGLGYHSRHHISNIGRFPVIYNVSFKSLMYIYLPLLPNRYFKFMDKQILINKQKGILWAFYLELL